MFFGAVVMFPRYASYHLMPLSACPELARTVSSGLKKRMQGKSRFNFRAPDEVRLGRTWRTDEGWSREIPGQELAVIPA